MSGGFRLVLRDELLAPGERASDRSAAFAPGGESRFAPGEGEPGGGRRWLPAVLDLARAASRTFDIQEWLAGFGSGPDDLTALDERAAPVVALRREFATLDLETAVTRLARLATAPRSHGAEVAIAAGPQALQPLLAAFQPHAADARGFWLADAGLVIRFRCHGSSVVFKAHHPVLHQALEARCARRGFDLD